MPIMGFGGVSGTCVRGRNAGDEVVRGRHGATGGAGEGGSTFRRNALCVMGGVAMYNPGTSRGLIAQSPDSAAQEAARPFRCARLRARSPAHPSRLAQGCNDRTAPSRWNASSAPQSAKSLDDHHQVRGEAGGTTSMARSVDSAGVGGNFLLRPACWTQLRGVADARRNAPRQSGVVRASHPPPSGIER